MVQQRSRRSSPPKESQSLAKYWLEQHKSWQASGLTQAKFCAKHGLSLPSFCWWRSRLKKEGIAMESSTSSVESIEKSLRLVPVRVVDPEAPRPVPVQASTPEDPSSFFEVVLANGTCVRVPVDFDACALQRLLRTLEAVRC